MYTSRPKPPPCPCLLSRVALALQNRFALRFLPFSAASLPARVTAHTLCIRRTYTAYTNTCHAHRQLRRSNTNVPPSPSPLLATAHACSARPHVLAALIAPLIAALARPVAVRTHASPHEHLLCHFPAGFRALASLAGARRHIGSPPRRRRTAFVAPLVLLACPRVRAVHPCCDHALDTSDTRRRVSCCVVFCHTPAVQLYSRRCGHVGQPMPPSGACTVRSRCACTAVHVQWCHFALGNRFSLEDPSHFPLAARAYFPF